MGTNARSKQGKVFKVVKGKKPLQPLVTNLVQIPPGDIDGSKPQAKSTKSKKKKVAEFNKEPAAVKSVENAKYDYDVLLTKSPENPKKYSWAPGSIRGLQPYSGDILPNNNCQITLSDSNNGRRFGNIKLSKERFNLDKGNENVSFNNGRQLKEEVQPIKSQNFTTGSNKVIPIRDRSLCLKDFEHPPESTSTPLENSKSEKLTFDCNTPFNFFSVCGDQYSPLFGAYNDKSPPGGQFRGFSNYPGYVLESSNKNASFNGNQVGRSNAEQLPSFGQVFGTSYMNFPTNVSPLLNRVELHDKKQKRIQPTGQPGNKIYSGGPSFSVNLNSISPPAYPDNDFARYNKEFLPGPYPPSINLYVQEDISKGSEANDDDTITYSSSGGDATYQGSD
ncbi:uncharacterized protein KNAG_0B03275 [Huiozyma naganishii CBS 8797]|uniref:Uncharacterized protein n=1 Tax=Huiozyma naganishii (strain ATCC MYA-139 / BCRC 22969 / CBS 8797 / KCTC 17520 / NBRC 10181 / NCYC 3082 / Yp74L-3) TaxID=1071383 RepID=J7S3K1_HUIN7|nr:hypothetical protein KNAG_0B03275 [Kazachstania naganishii CBS 8797]CCK68769.1 hypothetical protein KNAG_0B03275 [Kazachstania naganishii CBS 8797]